MCDQGQPIPLSISVEGRNVTIRPGSNPSAPVVEMSGAEHRVSQWAMIGDVPVAGPSPCIESHRMGQIIGKTMCFIKTGVVPTYSAQEPSILAKSHVKIPLFLISSTLVPKTRLSRCTLVDSELVSFQVSCHRFYGSTPKERPFILPISPF